MIKKIFFFFIDTIQALIFAASIFIFLYLFIAQPNQVNGKSMMPNFKDAELLLTEKLSYRFNPPQRGDVVVFKAPPSEPCSENECEYIKRVIALPGEQVSVNDGAVYINGLRLNESYLEAGVPTQPGDYLQNNKTVTIPSGHYLLLGDNRPHSRDSREFGPISKDSIVGKAFFVYWPPSQSGKVSFPAY